MKSHKANIIFNKEGAGNFDVVIKKMKKTKESKTMTFKLTKHAIENLDFNFIDTRNNTYLSPSKINHEGEGNMVQDS